MESIHLYTVPLLVLLSLLASGRAMTTDGDQIIGTTGQAVQLKGANWFGFNNQATMVDGLWNPGNGLSFDFATVMYRWQLLGFNAIRLPFSMSDLYSLSPQDKYASWCNVPSFEQIVASTVPSSVNLPLDVAPPGPVKWADHTPTGCNGYVPSSSTLDRFVWVAQYLANNGFYVLLDNHLREDSTALTNPSLWRTRWVDIVTRIAADPMARERMMIDILNEPDDKGLKWTDVKDLYLSAMDEIYPVNPSALFFVEGCAQGSLGANWGDGFATDPASIQIVGSQGDPNPFFRALFNKPYLNQVVLSPHVYGPSVTHAGSGYVGHELNERLSRSFGTLTKSGYTHNGVTKRFPIAIGEFGSKFIDTRDISWLSSFKEYLNNQGGGADGQHNAIPNWFYWCWNDNSGDTGGLIDSSWVNIMWQKIDYLTSIGLAPWYLSPTGEQQSPPPPPSDGSSPPLPPTVVTSPPPAPTVVTSPPPPPAVVTSPPTPTVVSSPSPPPTTDGSFSCQVRVDISPPWKSGIRYYSAVNFFFRQVAGGLEIPTPWGFQVVSSKYIGKQGSGWNMASVSVVNGVLSGQATSNWQKLVPGGGDVNLGIILKGTGSAVSDFYPTKVMVKGMVCTLTN